MTPLLNRTYNTYLEQGKPRTGLMNTANAVIVDAKPYYARQTQTLFQAGFSHDKRDLLGKPLLLIVAKCHFPPIESVVINN